MKHIKLFEKYINNVSLKDLTENYKNINVDVILKLLKNENINIDMIRYIEKTLNITKRRSEELYLKYNIDGLVGNWIYPFNEGHKINEFLLLSLINLIHDGNINENIMKELYLIYLKLNPIIKNIPTNNDYYNMYSIMLGMTSGFNYDDIYDFVVVGGGSERDVNYMTKLKFVEKLISGNMYYIPSEKTLDKIINYFN